MLDDNSLQGKDIFKNLVREEEEEESKLEIKGKKIMIEKSPQDISSTTMKSNWLKSFNKFNFLNKKKKNKEKAVWSSKSSIFDDDKPKKDKIFSEFLTQEKMKWITTILLVIMVSFFILRPAIIGYSVIRQSSDTNQSAVDFAGNIKELELKLATTKANLSLYTEIYAKVWDEVKDTSNSLSTCNSEKQSLTSQVENVRIQWKDDIKSCEDKQRDIIKENLVLLNDKDKEIATAKSDLVVLQDDFDKFVQNIAKNVCCKNKVDNPSINSYQISSGKLICLENGENVLNC
jgi:hypothetical protein